MENYKKEFYGIVQSLCFGCYDNCSKCTKKNGFGELRGLIKKYEDKKEESALENICGWFVKNKFCRISKEMKVFSKDEWKEYLLKDNDKENTYKYEEAIGVLTDNENVDKKAIEDIKELLNKYKNLTEELFFLNIYHEQRCIEIFRLQTALDTACELLEIPIRLNGRNKKEWKEWLLKDE